MVYCPNCGSNNITKTAFNLYEGGDFECSDCEIEFYYGITKRDIFAVDEEEDNNDGLDIPEQPTNKSFSSHDCCFIGKCPNCGKSVDGYDSECNCGQKLDWK